MVYYRCNNYWRCLPYLYSDQTKDRKNIEEELNYVPKEKEAEINNEKES